MRLPSSVDARGNAVSAASGDTVARLDATIDAYLGARSNTAAQLAVVLAAEPDCAVAHCLDGYLGMLSSRDDGRARAADALRRVRNVAARVQVTPREERHVRALDAWQHGDMRGAAHEWDLLLQDHPRDLLAIKVSQFVLSYLGESDRMLGTVARVLPAWTLDVPGYGFLLGCHAYALEEVGHYARAEATGRQAVELNPSDIWAAHAVAHVAEMEGRPHDGLAWIGEVAGHWRECNNFANHLRWHQALLLLDMERYADALELYDHEVRRDRTDEYLDVTNAVSLLWRLEQAGIDVGDRWTELAACARRRADDHALVFVDLHYLMALAAARDSAAVDRFLDSCERFARGRSTEAEVMREVGLPAARAVRAHRAGAYGDVVRLLVPVRHHLRRIGASHAQRDLFDQLLIDAAWRAPEPRVAVELLAERTAHRPRNLWGWRHYAAVLDALGAPGAVDAWRQVEQLRGR
ncbi:MAG TPA: tetratricopeptide repeat protein [Gemmatimonadaceae bacterium]